MIKLKITSKEMKALSRYLQTCIEIARTEIAKGMDYQVYRVENNKAMREVSWLQADREKYVLRISERHAQIDEFEKLQRKLLLSYDKREGKTKTVGITKAAGYFILIYMAKAEAMIKEAYTNLVVSTQANTILKNLL